MNGRILTVNAGSSSIKVAVFAADGPLEQPLQVDQVDGIGSREGAPDHTQALALILSRLDVGRDGGRLVAVGHRIVHGGTVHERPALVDDALMASLNALSPLAPLHQPHNLAGVVAARLAFPGVPQVACFDTAFHRTQPAVQQRFALPARWHEAGIRRYGFHGLSYESIHAQLAATEPALAAGRVVVAHLGNGASMCAIHVGRSVGTTMSFSPLDGLTMGTRCGRLDAAVVLHLIEHHGLDAAAVSQLLHRESGLLGLSGVSSDVRTLLALEAKGDARAAEALEHFVASALRELAGMAAAMGGIDALVFTGGIGENAAPLRARIAEGAAWMGLQLDEAANARHERNFGRTGAPVQLRVLRTQEEAVIARHAARAAGLLPH